MNAISTLELKKNSYKSKQITLKNIFIKFHLYLNFWPISSVVEVEISLERNSSLIIRYVHCLSIKITIIKLITEFSESKQTLIHKFKSIFLRTIIDNVCKSTNSIPGSIKKIHSTNEKCTDGGLLRENTLNFLFQLRAFPAKLA